RISGQTERFVMGRLVSGKEHKSGYETNPKHLLRVLPAGRRVKVSAGARRSRRVPRRWSCSRASMHLGFAPLTAR
ncbi:MAG: hypothetical protein RH951_12915, partial [Parvibaculum sp.]